MKCLFATLTASAFALLAAQASADPLPMDTPVSVDGIQTVCTGVGSDKDDPRWQSYPVRVEFSNGAAQFLAGAQVTLSTHGHQIAAFECAGPWVLLQLPPGSYRVTAELTGEPNSVARSTNFVTPGRFSGQQRVEIQFPHMGANQ
ncbi:MAG: hypothetical protein JOZ55_04350 [Alphaproteobacteria bacterium]|nr:hypothetical protein [Alphaproteobacteria bacterium]